MNNRILDLLNENPRLTNKQLAVLLDTNEAEVAGRIAEMENDGIIGGYRAVIDWSRLEDVRRVTALIELKVTPKPDTGFEEIAAELIEFPEVESVYLMSGAYDFGVLVTGSTMQDIAMFVARRLSTLGSVNSTATHFVLKRYKENGVSLLGKEEDERGSMIL